MPKLKWIFVAITLGFTAELGKDIYILFKEKSKIVNFDFWNYSNIKYIFERDISMYFFVIVFVIFSLFFSMHRAKKFKNVDMISYWNIFAILAISFNSFIIIFWSFFDISILEGWIRESRFFKMALILLSLHTLYWGLYAITSQLKSEVDKKLL